MLGVKGTATVSVASGGYPGSVVSLTESWDTSGFHDNATNPSRFTIPAGFGGRYLIGATVAWGSDDVDAAARAVYYRKNGTIVGGSRDGDGGSFLVDVFIDVIEVADGDYFELNPYQESGSTLTGVSVSFWLERVEPLNDKKISELVAITDLEGTEEFVVADGGSSKKITAEDLRAALGGGGAFSPVDIPPETPDAFDDEFDDAASVSDWTHFGFTNAVDGDINTTIPGRAYVYRNAGGGAKVGGYYKAVTIPGTYLVKCGATNARENYHRGNVVVILPSGAISDASPYVGVGQFYVNGYDLAMTRHSDLSTFAATPWDGGSIGVNFSAHYPALWIRLKFNSATSVDVDVSKDGVSWYRVATAYNPGWNMGKIGWGVGQESGTTYPIETSWDYFRRIA